MPHTHKVKVKVPPSKMFPHAPKALEYRVGPGGEVEVRRGGSFWKSFWRGFQMPFEWIADNKIISKALPLLGPEAAPAAAIAGLVGLGKRGGRRGGALVSSAIGSKAPGLDYQKGMGRGRGRAGRGITYQPGLASSFSVAKF